MQMDFSTYFYLAQKIRNNTFRAYHVVKINFRKDELLIYYDNDRYIYDV